MNYKCPKCNEVNTEYAWNKQTMIYFECSNLQEIYSIDTIHKDVSDYCCPKCLKIIRGENIEQTN